jgi:Raf kinase inhibitor-like YbhB/YbcL family protein
MIRRIAARVAAAAFAAALFGAGTASAQTPATITVESPAFKDGGTIPKDFTGDTGARNVSPALTWTGAPATTKEFALILDDPDANFGGRGPFVHWVLYKIPGTAKGLPEAVPMGAIINAAGLQGAINGLTGFNAFARPGAPPLEPGYRGPAPPPGAPHHYHFTVYALGEPLTVQSGLDKAGLLKAMEGKIVAQGEIVGLFGR